MQCVPFNGRIFFWHAPAVTGINLLHKNALQNSFCVLIIILRFFLLLYSHFFLNCVCCTSNSVLLLSIRTYIFKLLVQWQWQRQRYAILIDNCGGGAASADVVVFLLIIDAYAGPASN